MVKVKCLNTVIEGGNKYLVGQEFETTPERAKGLGSLVEIIGQEKMMESPPKDKAIKKIKKGK